MGKLRRPRSCEGIYFRGYAGLPDRTECVNSAVNGGAGYGRSFYLIQPRNIGPDLSNGNVAREESFDVDADTAGTKKHREEITQRVAGFSMETNHRPLRYELMVSRQRKTE